MGSDFIRSRPALMVLSVLTFCLVVGYYILLSSGSSEDILSHTFNKDTGAVKVHRNSPSQIRYMLPNKQQVRSSKQNEARGITTSSFTNVSSPGLETSLAKKDKEVRPEVAHELVREKTSETEICPNEVQISVEQGKIKPKKEAISLKRVHAEIFGGHLEKIDKMIAKAEVSLPEIISLRRKALALKTDTMLIDASMAKLGLSVDVDGYDVLPGGHWVPTSCRPRWKVAIVVPFRDRFANLPIFFRHIVPLLKRQKLEFTIFISEQRNDIRFNRAMLMNVGFVEALNFTSYDCVVFHDVDHIALNVKNYFGCENMPRHFISGEAMWGYKIIYPELFGGVTGITTDQFHRINGLPNVYWGWGGEDDEFAGRVRNANLGRSRPAGAIGYFDTIEHKSNQTPKMVNPARFCLLQHQKERVREEGESNLVYEPPVIEVHHLYTNISTNIQRLQWKPNWTTCKGS